MVRSTQHSRPRHTATPPPSSQTPSPSTPAMPQRRLRSPDTNGLSVVSQEHARDRAKGISPFPGFRKGNLVKVRMENFLTFTDTFILPGPRMNLIIGPNGTGKSTVVSAVCIAFDGNPRLLGRSPDLGAFVKHGTSRAAVTVHIYEPAARSGERVVRREFDADGRGHFEIDGTKVNKAEMKKLCQRYDVQLDNLSQFMPQEKIAEFVNIKPDELLHMTVRSLGGVEREDMWSEISRMDEIVHENDGTLRKMKEKLERLVEHQQNSENEVQAYRQQQEIKKELDLMKRCVPLVEAIEYRAEAFEAIDKKQQLTEQLENMKSNADQSLRMPVNRAQQLCDAAQESYRQQKRITVDLAEEMRIAESNIEERSNRRSEAKTDIDRITKRAERRWKEVEQKKLKLQQAEEALASFDGVNMKQLDDKLNRLRQTKNANREEREHQRHSCVQAETQINEIGRDLKNANRALMQLQNVREMRVGRMEKSLGKYDLSKGMALVRRMKQDNQFHGNVYGPVVAEIEANNDYHRRILENCLGRFLLGAFVAENKADAQALLETAQRELKWRPDVVTIPLRRDGSPDDAVIQSQVPARPIDERLRNLGISAVVKDIFEAPFSVKAALCAQSGLHNVYVGDNLTEENLDAMRYEENVRSWFTPVTRCNVTGSRFDPSVRNLSRDSNFAHSRPDLLASSMEEERRHRMKLEEDIREGEAKRNQAKERYDLACVSLKGIDEKAKEIETDIREAMRTKLDIRKAQGTVTSLQGILESAKAEAQENTDEKDKESSMKEFYKHNDWLYKNIRIATKTLEQLTNMMIKFDELVIQCAVAKKTVDAEEQKYSEAMDGINEKRAQLKEASQIAKEARLRCRQKDQEAKAAFPVSQREEFKDAISQITSKGSDDLIAEIESLKAQVHGLVGGGERVLREYEERHSQIVRIQSEVQKHEVERGKKMRELQEQKTEFLEWLKSGIEKTRVKFSSLYQRLGCSGDLELVNMESERLSDLALQVLVSYRDDVEMRPISATANSGGEKMCCTMLFCFSLLLEEERMPPFIMVDELNQGLDYQNEMKIMTIMFEDAMSESAPQSFVITPKLVLNLPFHNLTKTHIIFNGTVSKVDDITAPVS